MTDAPAPAALPPTSRYDDEAMTLPIVTYVLYLLGFLTGGFTALVGVVIAYLQRREAGPRAVSHYVFLINTFWIAVVAYAAATVLMILGLPLLFLHGVGIVFMTLSGVVGFLATIWFLARCVIGLVRAAQGEGCVRPRAWLL